MLPENLTLNYDPTGGETPGDELFDRQAYETNKAFYRESDALAANSAYANNILLRIEEPKRSASSHGVTRHFCTLRAEEDVVTPSGVTSIFPQIIKLETSIPVGATPENKRAILERFKALLSHIEFENFFFDGEC